MRRLRWLGLCRPWRCCSRLGCVGRMAQGDYPNKPVRLIVGFTPGSVGRHHRRACSATA